MINPNLIKPTYASLKDVRTKRKVYAPAYHYRGYIFRAKLSHYKTATDALRHSKSFLLGWRERYAKLIEQMMAPAEPEKVQP